MTNPAAERHGPMTGVRVVEIGDLGELAGKLLADAGADVIRVEPPRGARSRHTGPFVGDRPDPNGSLHFMALNTNKRGVTVDLATPAGVAAWRTLAASADVVIDAAGPGVLDGYGAGSASCAEASRVIWCAITPFGLTGPLRDLPANDLVSMALGGIVMMCGYDDHELPPVRPDGEHSLSIAGEYAVAGVLAALLLRARTGVGQLLDVSIHEAVAGTTEGAFMNWEYLGRNPQRTTGRHAGTVEQWQILCSDGKYAVLFGGGIPRDRKQMEALLSWMEEYGAVGDLRDPQYAQVLTLRPQEGGEIRHHFAVTVQAFLQTRPVEEVYRRGQQCGLPWAPVRQPEETLDDPHWADRDFWATVEIPGAPAPARLPRAGYRFTKTPVEFRRRAPLLGEHNAEVLPPTPGNPPPTPSPR